MHSAFNDQHTKEEGGRQHLIRRNMREGVVIVNTMKSSTRQQTTMLYVVYAEKNGWHRKKEYAPTGNRTQGKCLEGIYVTTTPSAPCVTLAVTLKVALVVNIKILIKTIGRYDILLPMLPTLHMLSLTIF